MYLALQNAFQSPKAPRIPEPDLVTTAEDSVRQYQQGLQTKLCVLYDLCMDVTHRSRQIQKGGSVRMPLILAVDLVFSQEPFVKP
jgi:hypothetical protein